jgi:hypothetical protein
MDFLLRYRGELPAHKQCAEEKNAIRSRLHLQLFHMSQAQPLMGGVFDPKIETAKMVGRRMNVDHLRKPAFDTAAPTLGPNLFFRVAVGDYFFIPLVSRPHELVCESEIRWLRRERAGSLVQEGGDLDNRLKNLFDSLRMPHSPDELKGLSSGFRGQNMLCLLEDDALITKFSIDTHRIWEPLDLGDLADGVNETDVQIDMRVTIKSSHPMWGNIGFPSTGI